MNMRMVLRGLACLAQVGAVGLAWPVQGAAAMGAWL